MKEAHRVLRPGGRVLVTMIGRLIGKIGHMIWWYNEYKHRKIEEGKVMGFDQCEVTSMLASAGLSSIDPRGFVFSLDTLTIARKS